MLYSRLHHSVRRSNMCRRGVAIFAHMLQLVFPKCWLVPAFGVSTRISCSNLQVVGQPSVARCIVRGLLLNLEEISTLLLMTLARAYSARSPYHSKSLKNDLAFAIDPLLELFSVYIVHVSRHPIHNDSSTLRSPSNFENLSECPVRGFFAIVNYPGL